MGTKRVRELLRIWKDRRADEKTRLIESKIDDFRNRLDKLGVEKNPNNGFKAYRINSTNWRGAI